MKHSGFYRSRLSYIAAFIIGVILFAVFWQVWFGSASSRVVLAGMTGVAVIVSFFWVRNELKHRSQQR